MKISVWVFLLFCVLCMSVCSDGENNARQASDTIRQSVREINEAEEAENREPGPVETPAVETLTSRAETIVAYFCDQAVTGTVAARMISRSSPENFYLSDALAARLNELSGALNDGYSINVETVKEPDEGQYGYDEATFHVFVECSDEIRLGIELLYETKYNKFHEIRVWKP